MQPLDCIDAHGAFLPHSAHGGCRLASHKSPWILGSESLRNRNDFASGLGRTGVSTNMCLMTHESRVLAR